MKRRNFLRALIGTPTIVNGFGVRPTSSPLIEMLLGGYNPDNDNVLVIVQMSGGNDGLNTIIPLEYYNAYANARPNLAIPENAVLRLTGINKVGLHPAMTGMRDMYNDGDLSIVQSVGMANPNFSHFRATDIWMSGSDSTQNLFTGWMGRYLDNIYPGFPANYPNAVMEDPLAIEIGSVASLLTQGPAINMAMSIANVSSFYDIIGYDQLPVENTLAGQELQYVRTIAKQTQAYTSSIQEAAEAVTFQSSYPNTSLAAQLKIVARLIKGGLKTKIYVVHIGGFDTHSEQVSNLDVTAGVHANLLRQLSDALRAFQNDLYTLGIAEKVLGMTFSEFGRRIKSNESRGTDHGWAAPMFIFGNKAKAGIIGDTPELPAVAQVGDNLAYQFDYRTIYTTLLQNWLCSGASLAQNVLSGNTYSLLPIVEDGVCTPVPAPTESIIVEPEPFSDYTAITIQSTGGYVNLRVQNAQGQIVETLIDKTLRAGFHKVMLCTTSYPTGVYTIRFENNGLIVTRNISRISLTENLD